MADQEKLKQLESLMKQAGMNTGADLFKNKAFQKVSKLMGVEAPGGAPPSSAPPPESKKTSTDALAALKKRVSGGAAVPQMRTTPIPGKVPPQQKKLGRNEPVRYISAAELIAEYGVDIGYDQEYIDKLHARIDEAAQGLKELTADLEEKYKMKSEYKDEILERVNENVAKLRAITEKTTQQTISDHKRAVVAKDEKNILIIENSVTQRMIIKGKLKKHGYKNILEAKNGQQGFDLILDMYKDGEGSRIDLIVLDLELPGLSGREIINSLRSNEYFDSHPGIEYIPILIISNTKMASAQGTEMSEEELEAILLWQMGKPFKEEIFFKLLKAIFPEDF